MEACEAKEMEQMERLQFTDFMLFFTNLIMSRDSVHKLYTEFLLMCAYLRVCRGQTQAEAHYKGHKHARKLKALENQRNRQKNGPSTTGKERDRERAMIGGGTMPTDSHLKDITGINLSFFKGTRHFTL